MNQITALAKYLLSGNVVTIMNAFQLFGITNAPRECGRAIERKFDVRLDRTTVPFESRYGQKGTYVEYRLMFTDFNKPGIEKMRQYISEIENKEFTKKVKRGPKFILPPMEPETKSAWIQPGLF